MASFGTNTEFDLFISHPERYIIRPETDYPQVGTGVGELLPVDPRRVGYRVVNRSAVDVSWGFNLSITSANGDILAANNGALAANWWQDRELCTFPVYAISTGVAVNVRRTVFLLQPK